MKTITLTKGFIALVDDEDYDRVSAFKWMANPMRSKNLVRVYAYRKGRRVYENGVAVSRPSISMHRFILGCDNPRIDHQDGDGQNNQRCNLRPCTNSQNLANQKKTRGASRWKGVSRSQKY